MAEPAEIDQTLPAPSGFDVLSEAAKAQWGPVIAATFGNIILPEHIWLDLASAQCEASVIGDLQALLFQSDQQ